MIDDICFLCFSSTIVDILLSFWILSFIIDEKEQAMIKRNLYLEQIRPFYETPMIKVLTGLRRSGKSTMLLLIKQDLLAKGAAENQFFEFNLESAEGLKLQNPQSTPATFPLPLISISPAQMQRCSPATWQPC
jgi:hypothetical protein